MVTGKYAQLVQPFGVFLCLILAVVMMDCQSLCIIESNKQQLNISYCNVTIKEINVSLRSTERLSLFCTSTDRNAELSYLWKQSSNGTWQNLRKNVENSSVCHSAPGQSFCDIDLDAKESNYIFCCTEAPLGSPNNVVTNCSNITITALPPALVTDVVDRTTPELLTPVATDYPDNTEMITTATTDPLTTQTENPRTEDAPPTQIVIAVLSVAGGLTVTTIVTVALMGVVCHYLLRLREKKKKKELLQTTDNRTI